MPKGLALISWDDIIGTELSYIYPPSLELKSLEIICIYTSQTFGDIKNPRFATFSTNNFKVATYFGGISSKSMLVLLLNDNEIPEVFKQALKKAYNEILNNKKDLSEIIPQILHIFELESEKCKNFFEIVRNYMIKNIINL